jgi:hypothetical protein
MARDTDREQTGEDRPPADGRGRRPEGGVWFTSTILQTLVAIIGLIGVLFALSMALGVDLLGMLADALSTQTGQWLAIAFVVLMVTAAAVRALSYARAPP